MAKFKRSTGSGGESIPTSALPDIIFILLFFFMVSTKMKETNIMVKTSLPDASQIQKLDKNVEQAIIYIGKPKLAEKYGKEPKIQMNDRFITAAEVQQFVKMKRAEIPGAKREGMIVNLKVDEDAKMGLVADAQQSLRKADALKVNYATVKRKVK